MGWESVVGQPRENVPCPAHRRLLGGQGLEQVFADNGEGLEVLGAQGGYTYTQAWGQSSREQWGPCPRLVWFPPSTSKSETPLGTGAVSKKTRCRRFSSTQEVTVVVAEEGVNGTPCM